MTITTEWIWGKKDDVALAVYSAELCLKHFETIFPNDKRPREAIASAKNWIQDPSVANTAAANRAALSAELAARTAWASWSIYSAVPSRKVEAAWLAARSASWTARAAALPARSALLSKENGVIFSADAADLASRSAIESQWMIESKYGDTKDNIDGFLNTRKRWGQLAIDIR